MKKIVLIFVLSGVAVICMSLGSAIADPVKVLSETGPTQVNHSRQKTVKKRRKVVKRRISARRRERMNQQLKQANKHLKNEKKAQQAQSKVKTGE